MDPAPVSMRKYLTTGPPKTDLPEMEILAVGYDHGEGRDPLDQLGIVPKDVVWSIVRDWTDRKVTG